MAPFRSYRYPLREVLPPLDELARYLHAADAEHPVYAIMEQRLAELQTCDLEAVGGYLIVPVGRLSPADGSLTAAGVELQTGAQVCGYLKGAEEAALFLCTAGARFSDEVQALNAAGDFLEAYVLDAIGSLTVERAMDRIQRSLETEQAVRGWKITNRYSPGYCNWPLKDQRALFELIGANPTGITLSPSCLMSPIKSVSGIIGLGPTARRREYGCVVCRNETCIYRKITARANK